MDNKSHVDPKAEQEVHPAELAKLAGGRSSAIWSLLHEGYPKALLEMPGGDLLQVIASYAADRTNATTDEAFELLRLALHPQLVALATWFERNGLTASAGELSDKFDALVNPWIRTQLAAGAYRVVQDIIASWPPPEKPEGELKTLLDTRNALAEHVARLDHRYPNYVDLKRKLDGYSRQIELMHSESEDPTVPVGLTGLLEKYPPRNSLLPPIALATVVTKTKSYTPSAEPTKTPLRIWHKEQTAHVLGITESTVRKKSSDARRISCDFDGRCGLGQPLSDLDQLWATHVPAV